MFKRKNRDVEDVIYKRNQENGSEMMLCLLFVALLDVARGTIWTEMNSCRSHLYFVLFHLIKCNSIEF